MDTMESTTSSGPATAKLVADLKVLIADAEALLRETAGMTGEKIAAIRARAEASVRRAKGRMEELQPLLADRAHAVVSAGEAYTQSNPWTALGIAAGVGAILGLLIGRR